MKHFIFLLFFLSGFAHAGNFTLKLRDVLLPDFAYLVFTDIHKHSFILDHDFINAQDLVTVNIFGADSDGILDHLKHVVTERGYKFSEYGGIYYISKIRNEESDFDILVYHPKFRSADYLRELAGTLFDRQGFSSNRVITNGDGNFSADNLNNDKGINSLISRKDLDAVVFQGTFKEVQKLGKLLADLDKPFGEVLVKAVVYEVRKGANEGNAVSLALGLLESVKGLGIRIESGTVDNSNAIKIQSSNIQAVWSALSGDSRFSLVSAPTLRIRSGGDARFMAGQEVPTLGAVSYNGDGQQVQSIDYRSAGVILELHPEIREAVTDLSITQQISSFIPTSTGVNNSPTLLKRELKTSVTVANDEIIILGGLDEKTDNESREGLSFLPAFLKGKKTETNQTEIMLVLHVQRI
jgi:type II secretory pathway component GspD/PulD (secretin)